MNLNRMLSVFSGEHMEIINQMLDNIAEFENGDDTVPMKIDIEEISDE